MPSVMSNEEIVALVQKGDNSLMLQLWDGVAGLVKNYAHRVYTALEGHRGITLDDLIQEGYIALSDAVASYDPNVAAFSTWFVIHLQKRFQEVTGQHGKRKKNEPIDWADSIDRPLLDSEDITLEDIIEDNDAADSLRSVEDRIWLDQLREVLRRMLLEMPEKQSDVLYRRYWRNQSIAQASEEMGIPDSSVRVNEYKGLAFLRNPQNRKHLDPFVYFDCYQCTGLGAFKKTGMSVQERYMERKYG